MISMTRGMNDQNSAGKYLGIHGQLILAPIASPCGLDMREAKSSFPSVPSQIAAGWTDTAVRRDVRTPSAYRREKRAVRCCGCSGWDRGVLTQIPNCLAQTLRVDPLRP